MVLKPWQIHCTQELSNTDWCNKAGFACVYAGRENYDERGIGRVHK